MNLKISDLYSQLLAKAHWSHTHGRNVFGITQSDVDGARLFDYAYRSQAIGTFHATRVALEDQALASDTTIAQARMLLSDLEAKAGDPVPRDFRALVSTLYFYDQWVIQIARLLKESANENPPLEKILENFIHNIERVTSCRGIYLARDLSLPEQGAFLVPNLGISILPLIYGDHHSWNAAFLSAGQFGVSVHRHLQGAEIHLGFSPTRGQTILGSHIASVDEGYAMPIPPMTDHGFHNRSGHGHILPFVFGSMTMTGWGVFFDVEARSNDEAQREFQPLDSKQMNHSVFLDRAIQKFSTATTIMRGVLIPAERAGSPEIGGLELSVNAIPAGEVRLASEHYRIVSIRSGKGRVSINGWTTEVGPHDHFGVPAGLSCCLSTSGADPLVYLDVMMLPVPSATQK
jgi:mannose-6-phosphate isomerase-like protein (cupin superfamily)